MNADKMRDLVKTRPVWPDAPNSFPDGLRRLIEETRQGVAVAVTSALIMLYWRIGKRIDEEILQGEWAEYGKGFSYSALTRMLKFCEGFPDPKIVAALWLTI
jgi:hypothetical protein